MPSAEEPKEFWKSLAGSEFNMDMGMEGTDTGMDGTDMFEGINGDTPGNICVIVMGIAEKLDIIFE